MIDERVYREVVSRIEQEKVPLYPSLIRKKAITRYRAEKVAEMERARAETERKIAEERRRRARAERKRREQWEEQQTELQKASEAGKWKVHTGSWVKIKDNGVSVMGIAAMSPTQAKALGYKWGTSKSTDGGFKFVSLPGEPTDAEYYGILEGKFEKGQYKHSPKVEQQIRKEIELGSKKFGVVAPAWAGGYMKQYEAAARTIKAAYTKAAESERKPTPAELKKAGTPPPTPRPVTKQDISKYQELATLGQHPDVQAHIAAMQKLQTESEQLQTRGTELQRQTKAQKELVAGADKAFEEYAKGGWTPEEAISYGFLTAGMHSVGKELEPKLAEYQKKAELFETLLKQPKSSAIEQFEAASKAFREQYSPRQITEMGKAMIVTFPGEKAPSPTTKEPEITYGALGEIIRDTGVIPTIALQEKPEVRPTAAERLVEKGKHITGYYPEKRGVHEATISAYMTQQLGLADSLGVTHQERGTGKRYFVVNGTKYTEGTKGFDEHLGEAIQGVYPVQPIGVKTRQEAIQEAAHLKTQFTDIYGGKAGEPIILLTPESRKAFEKLETSFEGIPEETVTTKAYWKEVEKMRGVHPQIEGLNVLAGQATEQAKEMKKIQEEKWFGVPHKIETTEERYSPYTKKAIPPVKPYAQVESAQDFLKAFETTHIHAYERKGLEAPPLTKQKQREIKEAWEEGQRISRDYRKLWGLSPEPYEWELKAGQLRAGFIAGQIEEIREHPIKGAVTIASFAALPPIFKGAGAMWKGTGMAAKVPRITKWAPRLAMGGMGAGYGGMVGMEVYKAPTMELKGEVLGRTSVELAEMGAGMYLGMKTMPSYIKGMEVSAEGAVRSYKGLGVGKTGRPVIGMFKEMIKTPEVSAMQKAIVLGKDYPALQYLKGIRVGEFGTPELGVGAKAFGKQKYTEIGIGKAIKYERMRMEGLWGKDYFLPERIPISSEAMRMPELIPLPPPKPVLWERVGPTTLAKRATTLAKTKQPKPIRERGIRVEKPIIPTYTELAKGRAYQITKGYDAFEMGVRPSYLKILGLGKKPKSFGKGVEEFVHPFRKKFRDAYEPSMLDYQPPRGLLTEGLRLDMTRAKIRPSERPLSPIEKLYQRRTPEDIFRDFGFGEKPTAGMKEVSKPIETRFLKFTKEGELIPQPEPKISVPKAKRGVAVKPEVTFDFEVAGGTALSRAKANAARLFGQKKEPKIGKTKEKKRLGFELSPSEAFGKTPKYEKGAGAAFWHSLVSTPSIVPIITPYKEQEEEARRVTEGKGFVFPGYEAAFKPIATTIPKEKEHVKAKPFTSIAPEFAPAPFPKVEVFPMEEPAPKPVPAPKPPLFKPPPTIPTTFIEPPAIPPILLPPLSDKKKPKRKKHTKKDPYEWFVKHRIPTLEEMFGTPAHSKPRRQPAPPDGADMMNDILNNVPKGFK